MAAVSVRHIFNWLQLALIAMTLAITSCRHKELCLQHPHTVNLKVEFDWRNAPDANPDGMCVYFYPVDGGTPQRYDFRGTTGGTVELTVGEYNVITYNNDTEGVLFANQHEFGKHQAYTRAGDILEPVLGSSANVPRANGTEEEKVVITPDMLWGCTSLNVSVNDTGISYMCTQEKESENHISVSRDEHILTLYPDDQVCHYSYEIRNVENLNMATQMCASLSGMAGGMVLALEQLFSNCVTLPLEANIELETSRITGEFYTFGHKEENTAPHKMLLYVWMIGGEKYYFGEDSERFDVTQQIHTAPNRKRVHIIIDGLELPKQLGGGDDWHVSVDDWDVVHEDLIM